jgi:SAM-dependent methyltransferase
MLNLFTKFNKLTPISKILCFIVLFLLLNSFFKTSQNKEGFIQKEEFLFKTKIPDIYDDFYASIYDYLVFNQIKNDYEVGIILNEFNPKEQSIILDVGSGTGHHVAQLSQNKNVQRVIGIDVSPSMIKKAKENYPQLHFKQGDVLNNMLFNRETFTHIVCLYFTIYYIKDKASFFRNTNTWLMSGGFLILHLVEPYKFDPILPPGNPLLIVSPQKYADKRITETNIKFNEFDYNSKFMLNDNDNNATFTEKIKFNDTGKTRQHEHTFYMEPINDIVSIAMECGFNLYGKIDLMNVSYDYQYLYIFVKP